MKTQSQGDFWSEVEVIGRKWQESLLTGYPLIPLNDLRPLWNSAVNAGGGSMERMRLESHALEVVLLKAENTRLKRELAVITRAAEIPHLHLERRRTERRR